MRKIGTVIIGTDREIRSLVNKLWDDKTNYHPSHCNFPYFRKNTMYGVDFDHEDMTFYVLSSETIVRLMDKGLI